VSSVQLTPSVAIYGKYAERSADASPELFVHYVAKLSPCVGEGDVFLDGYLGPKMGKLPQSVQLDETKDLLVDRIVQCVTKWLE
jgi:hypothetical protein